MGHRGKLTLNETAMGGDGQGNMELHREMRASILRDMRASSRGGRARVGCVNPLLRGVAAQQTGCVTFYYFQVI